jgi:ankyrin repeat protein
MIIMKQLIAISFILSCLAANQGFCDNIIEAVKKGDLALVKELLDVGANVNETHNGWTPLMYAASYGYPEIVKALISAHYK